MLFSVTLQRKAQGAIDKLSGSEFRSIIASLRGLAENPRPPGCIKLQGRSPAWRIRVGNFRVIYAIIDSESAVIVLTVERRSERTYRDIDQLF